MSRKPGQTPEQGAPGSGASPHRALLGWVWGSVLLGTALVFALAQPGLWQSVAFLLLASLLALAITLLLRAQDRALALDAQIAALQAAVEALGQTLGAQSVPQSLPIAQSKLDALAAAQEQTDSRLTLFFSRRGAAATLPSAAEGEPRLALEDAAPVQAAGLGPSDLVRALHFPEDADDTEGFDALRVALSDSRTAPLIRAAQDVLTHLAQEGIYMDDLRPDRARPEFWRAFAQGARGALVAPLGGIRDRSCLALTAARMRNNPDFKAAAHLFLREFDKVLASFEKVADDAQIAALGETRSARAFMLLGRVSGVFSR